MQLPEIIRSYLDAYNRRDAEALIDCVTDDVIFENVSNSGQSLTLEGRDAFAGLARQAATMFSARSQVVRTAVVSGDQVALEIDWSGTPAVDLGPMKAGVAVAMRGASFFTLRNGKIARIVDLS
ncbi:MAG: nuclear transport factor 2 family protein [Allosphingosinicella sp.]|uniref:nuclear transport factor 2 family protein n=1 Tax=Allosphingosinicella sp. TaxID=2823234 RepID=UPI003936572D